MDLSTRHVPSASTRAIQTLKEAPVAHSGLSAASCAGAAAVCAAGHPSAAKVSTKPTTSVESVLQHSALRDPDRIPRI